MKAEYIHKGENLYYTNPTEDTISAGTIIMIGNICSVAAADIKAGETGAVATVGVWQMPKDSNAITAGATVYYNAENDVASAEADTTPLVLGTAVEAAAATDTNVLVRLGEHTAAASSGTDQTIGDLDDLTTTDKDTVVAAINELVTRVAALEAAE